jgi:hypothetical protein
MLHILAGALLSLTTTIIVTTIIPQGMRGTDVLQRRATGRPATAIEADMDRLFARRVTVFGPVSLGDSTEAVLNTVLKVRVQGWWCGVAVCVCHVAAMSGQIVAVLSSCCPVASQCDGGATSCPGNPRL